MVARRSLRKKLNEADKKVLSPKFTGVLATRNGNLKRQASEVKVSLPKTKKRRVAGAETKIQSPRKNVHMTTIIDGRLCSMTDIVTRVTSDSPLSKSSSLGSDDEDNALEAEVQSIENAKKTLFDIKVKSTDEGVAALETDGRLEAPKSTCKFFKNRTPQKSKILAARSKSLALIRQNCFKQKLPASASKENKRIIIKKEKPRRYNELKFINTKIKTPQNAQVESKKKSSACEQTASMLTENSDLVEKLNTSNEINAQIHVSDDQNADEAPLEMSDENSSRASTACPSDVSMASGPVLYPRRSTRAQNLRASSRSASEASLVSGPVEYACRPNSAEPSPLLRSGLRLRSSLTEGVVPSPIPSVHSPSLPNSASLFSSQSSQLSKNSTPKSQTRIAEILEGFMTGDEDVKNVPQLTRYKSKQKTSNAVTESPGQWERVFNCVQISCEKLFQSIFVVYIPSHLLSGSALFNRSTMSKRLLLS